MTAKVDAIRRVVRRCMPLRTPDKPEHGAYHVDAPSMQRRLARITSLVRPDERVLCVGDDDLTSLCLHWLGYRHVTLVDFDGELIETVARESKRKIQTITHDLGPYIKQLPKLRQGFDLFVLRPALQARQAARVFRGRPRGPRTRGARRNRGAVKQAESPA
ncbi:MAG: bis-aminopropyl spermidine synthase family protein [Polyangiaceae bacterium]